MSSIDKKDKRILFELDCNSRQSINMLAKKARLSKDVVRYRIKQLEDRGVITCYYTLIDFSKLGYDIIRLYLKLQDTDAQLEEAMVQQIMRHESVIITYRTDGEYELAVGIIAKDLREGQKIIEEVINPFRQQVIRTNVSIFNDFVQFPRYYLHDEQEKLSWSTGSYEPYAYDQDDLRILDQIAEDARKPVVEIAKALQMPATTIAYRMRQMEKQGVIVAYRALIDFRKLGMEYYKIDLTLEDLSVIPALQEFCKQHPSIIYRDVTVAGSDFEFDAELLGQEAFYAMMEEIKTTFPHIVRTYFYYKAIHIYKYSYFPKKLVERPS